MKPPTTTLAQSSLAVALATLSAGLASLAGCHHGSGADVSSDAGMAATAAAPDASGASGPCGDHFEILVPFQKYGESDLIRAIVVDGGEVYFRTYHETYRVPLAGGPPVLLTKSPGGMDGPLWVVGDRLVTQPNGQAAFMAMPKTGGGWTTLLDASTARHVGQSLTAGILQSIGSGHTESARDALFDGTHFAWLEHDASGLGNGHKGTTTWRVRRMAAAGGAAETLYTTPRELQGLALAGGRLVFQEDETVEPKLAPGAKKPLLEVKTWSLLTVPTGGGKAEVRLNPYFGVDPVSDGAMLYFSGFRTLEDGGMWRMPVTGASPPEKLDPLVVEQRWGTIYGGDRLVFWSPSMADAPRSGHMPDLVHYLLTGPSGGTKFERTLCLDGKYEVHAHAVAGKALLLSLFVGSERVAGIVKITLP